MPPSPEPEQTVADLLERWPEAAPVFVRRGMACVGCVMAPFMTIRDAAASYGLETEDLLADLAGAARAPAGR